METQKAKKCELLAEFVKPNESQWLAGAELDAEDKLEEMRSIMTSNGTEISSLKRWQLKRAEMDEVKISFRLTRPIQDDQDGDNEPSEEDIQAHFRENLM